MAWREDYKFTPVYYAFNDLYNALKARDMGGNLAEKPSTFSKCYMGFIDSQIDNVARSVVYTVPADNSKGETTNKGGFIDISTPSKIGYYYFDKLLKQVAASDVAIAQKNTSNPRDPFFSYAWLVQRIAMINLLRYFHPAEITYNVTFYKYKMWFLFSEAKFHITQSEILEDGEETLENKYAYTSIQLDGKVTTSKLDEASKHYPKQTDPEFHIEILIPKSVTIKSTVPAVSADIFSAYVGNNSSYTGYVTASKPSNTYGVYNFPLPFSLDSEKPYFNSNNAGVLEFNAYKNTFNSIIEFLYTLTSPYDIGRLNCSLKVILDYPYLDLYDTFEYK